MHDHGSGERQDVNIGYDFFVICFRIISGVDDLELVCRNALESEIKSIVCRSVRDYLYCGFEKCKLFNLTA